MAFGIWYKYKKYNKSYLMERVGKLIFLCELRLYTYTESGRINM